jgi:hypothetical protein
MKTLKIDEKWSVQYDETNNDKPILILRYGSEAGKFHSEMQNWIIAMFYALLEKTKEPETQVTEEVVNGPREELTTLEDIESFAWAASLKKSANVFGAFMHCKKTMNAAEILAKCWKDDLFPDFYQGLSLGRPLITNSELIEVAKENVILKRWICLKWSAESSKVVNRTLHNAELRAMVNELAKLERKNAKQTKPAVSKGS